MNKNTQKLKLILLSFVFLILPLCACNSEKADKPDITVTVYIKGPQGFILENAPVVVSEGDSVLKALSTACENNDIELEYTGSGSFAYIKSIGGFKEFALGGNSGWIYMVDEEKPNVGVGSKKLSDNNVIKFYYSEDLGADVLWEE